MNKFILSYDLDMLFWKRKVYKKFNYMWEVKTYIFEEMIFDNPNISNINVYVDCRYTAHDFLNSLRKQYRDYYEE